MLAPLLKPKALLAGWELPNAGVDAPPNRLGVLPAHASLLCIYYCSVNIVAACAATDSLKKLDSRSILTRIFIMKICTCRGEVAKEAGCACSTKCWGGAKYAWSAGSTKGGCAASKSRCVPASEQAGCAH